MQSTVSIMLPTEPMQPFRTLSVMLLVSMMIGTSATAQLAPGPDTTGADRGRSDPVTQTDPSPRIDTKSPGWATTYSMAGTLLLAPVFGSGLIVGPSFGHFYADNTRQAITGIGLRVGGGTAFVAGLTSIDQDSEVAGAIGLAGLSVVLGSALYDIQTAGDAARAYNARHRRQALLLPTADRNGQVGLALRVQL